MAQFWSEHHVVVENRACAPGCASDLAPRETTALVAAFCEVAHRLVDQHYESLRTLRAVELEAGSSCVRPGSG